MGTWGNGPFDDDAASDWAWELEEATDWGVVDVALRSAVDVGANRYLGATAGQIAWAAAAVVAAVDDPSISLPDEISDWLRRLGAARPREARALAVEALRRVLGEKSELVELWRESGEEDVWRARVEDVAAVLADARGDHTTVGDVVVEERTAEAAEPRLPEPDAMTLAKQANRLHEDLSYERAIERYDLLMERFGAASDPAVREQVEWAMVGKGQALLDLDRPEEAVEAFDLVVQRLGETREPVFREALLWKGLVVAQLASRGSARPETAIELADLFVERFGDDPAVAVRIQVASCLIRKGRVLDRIGRSSEAIETFDLVVKRVGDDSAPGLRKHAQRATDYKEEIERRSPGGSAT